MPSKKFGEAPMNQVALPEQTVSAVVTEIPLRRDLAESLPPTPADFDSFHFPPTVAAVKALLPPTLKAQFEREIDETPFQQLEKLVMEWGAAAISLHSDDAQESLEALEDGDREAIKALFSALPK